MSWYVLDAVDVAIYRTKKCLFQPFEFWKWIKIAIILLFVGGGSGYGGNFGGSYPSDNTVNSSYGVDNLSTDIGSISDVFIGFIILLILLIVLLFAYVGSVLEFVFVDSLVTDNVKLRKFFNYTGKGLNLLLIKIVAGIITMFLIGILLIPIGYILYTQGVDNISYASVFIIIASGIILLFLFILMMSALNSFISMAIPISIYTGIGLIASIKQIFNHAKAGWKEIIVYWIGRGIISIALFMIALILLVIGLITIVLPFILIDYVVYMLLSSVGSIQTIVLAIFIILQVLICVLLLFLSGVPLGVFSKYHMLSFLEKWHTQVKIPFIQSLDLQK